MLYRIRVYGMYAGSFLITHEESFDTKLEAESWYQNMLFPGRRKALFSVSENGKSLRGLRFDLMPRVLHRENALHIGPS